MNEKPNLAPQYITVQELADEWRVSPSYLYRLIRRGDIRALLVGGPDAEAVEEAERKADEPGRWNEPDELAPLSQQDAALVSARAKAEGEETSVTGGTFRILREDADAYLQSRIFRPAKKDPAPKKQYIGLAEINAEARALRTEAEHANERAPAKKRKIAGGRAEPRQRKK